MARATSSGASAPDGEDPAADAEWFGIQVEMDGITDGLAKEQAKAKEDLQATTGPAGGHRRLHPGSLHMATSPFKIHMSIE